MVNEELEVTGLWMMREYMQRRQATIADYITGRPIYELFRKAERMEGLRRFLRSWDK